MARLYLLEFVNCCLGQSGKIVSAGVCQLCCCLGQSGKIARQLEFVSHSVRTKLDELKRTEMERLLAAIQQKQHMKDGRSWWMSSVGRNVTFHFYTCGWDV